MLKKVSLVMMSLVVGFLLTACGSSSQDLSGKWYYSGNSEATQFSLDISGKDVTLNYAYVDYQTGWFNVKAEEKKGKLVSGEITSSNEIKVNKVYDLDDAKMQKPFGDVDKMTYKLSQDKETLSISTGGSEKLDFVKKNPKELNLSTN